MHRKRKLLIITNLYPVPWDLQRATFNKQQFAGLMDEWDVSILVPVSLGEWLKNRRLIKQSDALRIVPYFHTPKLGRRFYSYTMLASLILHSGYWIVKSRPVSVMATWAYPDAVAASKIARLLKVPFYFKVHGSDINVHAKFPHRARQIQGAARRANRVICVSKSLAERLENIGVPAHKISVLYNGVDHERFGGSYSAPHDRSYVLFVGNIIVEKGVFELLEAFAEVAESFPSIDLFYVGTGRAEAKLKSRATDLAIQGKVHFSGQLPHGDLAAWMTCCEFLALPSYREGVPNVLLEAMACGVPVLASRVGGIPEIINSPDLGLLIPANDSMAIVDAFPQMISGKWDKAIIKSHAAKYSWPENKKNLVAILQDDSPLNDQD